MYLFPLSDAENGPAMSIAALSSDNTTSGVTDVVLSYLRFFLLVWSITSGADFTFSVPVSHACLEIHPVKPFAYSLQCLIDCCTTIVAPRVFFSLGLAVAVSSAIHLHLYLPSLAVFQLE